MKISENFWKFRFFENSDFEILIRYEAILKWLKIYHVETSKIISIFALNLEPPVLQLITYYYIWYLPRGM